MNYLCKKNPTDADLQRVKRELREHRKVIEDYLAGNETWANFMRAKARVEDLCFLVNLVVERSKKPRLTLVK